MDESSVSEDEPDMNESTWTDKSGTPSEDEKMRSPHNLQGADDDDSSSESCNGNVFSTLNPSTVPPSTARDASLPDINGNSTGSTVELTASTEDQPINLSDKVRPSVGVPPYPTDGCTTEALRNRGKYVLKAESPPYSSGSYDSVKTDVSGCAEDLTVGRTPVGDDDDDDDHEDNDRITDTEGLDPERLKAFNMFVRLFVDENLDRMVPISKQPKEKIQAIIESCSRQFPEFQERARKRIRTYLKSCRRMKKNGMEMVRTEARDSGVKYLQARPTPPHLTSAMAENILAAACESESRKAAKRMRLEIYQNAQEDSVSMEKPAGLAQSTYSLPSGTFNQDPVYVNGSLHYTYRGYGPIGGNLPPPTPVPTGNHSNGPTDLSMKALATGSTHSNATNRAIPCAQLSPTEIGAVRQLIAGYRESAAFLLRSADELENLILQQN
ncbi:nucleolar protein 4-like isoform X1 [Pelobates fuscus]|uniref:nucleolar protein 4-like isoform X1 n=2 Tax=Pelobates fuscus TaxID=191477 RepID=UPI002FE45ED5